MNFEIIWQKICEYAIMFYNYAMTQGESNFMLVDMNFINGNDVPKEALYFFIGSFVVMILAAVFACDSLNLFHPIEGIREWKSKISIVKIVIFTAAVFSFHTFYKMLVGIFGGVIGADASIRALECVGSYINPIAIMIYAFTICTMTFRRQWFQAFMLGLALFLTPSAMLFYGFTNEHIAIYATAGVIAVTGGILHAMATTKKCSPFVACFVLDIVYFISKFFMVYYSNEVKLITATDYMGKIKQYLACVEMDLIFALILLLVLFAYKVATTENASVKENVVLPMILGIFVVFSIIFGRTELQYQPDYEQAITLWEDKKYEAAMNAFEALHGYKDSEDYIDRCREEINNPIYNEGMSLMEIGNYEDAIAKLTPISDYKDSAEKITECERNLLPKLAGIWHGTEGSVIVLNEDGSCHYSDSSNEGNETWSVDDDNVIHITNDGLGYEIYADLEDSYRTISMMVKSDSSSWRNEEFTRLIDFSVNPENNNKLAGAWQGSQGSVITLNEDGTCYYVDGSSGEGNGTWYVDNQAMIRIDTEVFDYQLYALLTNGYDTATVMMKATGSSWRDEEFVKQ